MRHIVLASTSSYRRDLLSRLGIAFDCVDPELEEETWKSRYDCPMELVRGLAEAKARAVARKFPDALIVGADQAGEVNGDRLDKPGTPDRAVAQLRRMNGRSHRLLTGVCLLDARTNRAEVEVDVTELTMRLLTEAQIANYVELDRPLGCAGSYRIESRGISLFERIESDDHTAIVGLPLIRLTSMFARAGVSVL